MGKDWVRLRYWAVLVVPLLLAFLSPSPATAQQGAVENVPDTSRRSQQELEEAAKAADTGFVTASGTFNLLTDPFSVPPGNVDITEGGPTTHVPGLNANDNRIEVKYRLVNDGGIATRIEHTVNYGEPQGAPTRTLTGSGSNSR